ncbi:NlpC/P60 family protein [Streptomyces sp. MW-W600-10]|uniref:C40 family peptidase n=1 Tax=Streptomyces sp. MW-W600-10 TaxID=2829819 RepID=UPI001C460781|nr:NlpC/P60 family protein [Streptomyces sp. MW-W600-10]MBV7249300.1 C40 family peptidase [Streptomyces sp. MW-W600-10]
MSAGRRLAGGLSVAAAGMGLLILAALAHTFAATAEEEENQRRHTLMSAGTEAVPAGPSSVDGINAVMLSAYTRAAARTPAVRPTCTGMRWSVIAGIGAVESNHAAGRTVAANGDITPRIIGPRLDGSGVGGNTTAFTDTDGGRHDGDTAYDRAVGPMQFLPSTWSGPSGSDGNDDGTKDPHNAFDAALGTAVYLCGTGTSDLTDGAQLRKAVLRYNNAGWYADKVISRIRAYDQLGDDPTGGSPPVGGRAGAVVQAALSKKGTRYVWGGGDIHGPTNGGFDCSGLMVYAFYQGAGITLPRTSQTQRGVGTKVTRTELRPGDLIVINNDGAWGHVGLYIGDGNMVHAPNPKRPVETVPATTGYWSQYDWDIRRVL